MFFRIYNQPKNKSASVFITLILLSCFIITMNGCETTSAVRYPKGKLAQSNSKKEIAYIILNNGNKIITKGKNVFYADSIKALIVTDKTGVYDTLKNHNKKEIKPDGKKTIIPVSNILEVFMEKTEINAGLTTLLLAGIIAGVAITTIVIKNATSKDPPQAPPTPPEPPPPPPPGSCPLIYSFDGEKYVFDGEPISGVISEGLTRTDLTRLDMLNPSEGKFKLHIKNQPGEKEMLDELKLVYVSHEENTFITPNPEGEFFQYKEIIRPESVYDESGNDVSVFFNEKDNIRWQTQMTFDTSFKSGTERHKLKFRFKKPENAGNALLFVNCGTAYWGSNMIREFLQLKGNKIDEWYIDLHPGSKELFKLYMFLGREELFTLNVNLREGDKYIAKTFIPAGGPLMDEDRIIRLPLYNVTGDYVEFVLNPPPGFWKIDQLGIIYDYEITEKNKIKELNAVYAADQDGKDLISEINSKDKIYCSMPDEGNYLNVSYEVPPDFDRLRNEIFLKTTGHYVLYTDKEKSEQTDLFEELMSTPGKILEYSMMIYGQSINQMAEIIKHNSNK